MSIFDFIAEIGKTIVSPIATLIDDLNTSDEEKLILKNQLQEMNLKYQAKILDLDSQLLDSKTKIIVAEAQGKSWLQRNWRPMLMCLFGIIIANNYILNPWLSELFDIDVLMDIPPQMWSLLKLGISGYVVGRTVEKGIKEWKK